MYEKYFLEKEQLDIISNWFTKNEPLFIYGKAGCGKTSLAKEIFKDRIITKIDSLYMKNNTNIFEYIQNIIQKRNITMMFEKKKEKRGLIIDDIDVFYKHDKKIFKSVISLLNSNLYDTKVIITCTTKFIINRALNKLKFSKFHLIYDNYKIHKICKNICSEKDININLFKKNELIIKSSGNINILISLLSSEKKNLIIQDFDNFQEENELYNDIFVKKYSLKDMIRIYSPYKTKIGLDLLENIFDITDNIEIIKNIYDYYVLSDITETKSIVYCNFKDYDIIYTIYNIYRHIANINITDTNYISNKYISKSLIHVNSYKYNYHKDIIYFYLYLIKENNYNKNVINELLDLNANILNNFIKTFNYYYNSKIKYEKIIKLQIK